MNYLLIIAIIIVAVITTFLLLIFLPRPKCFYSFDEVYKDMASVNPELSDNEISRLFQDDANKEIKSKTSDGQSDKKIRELQVIDIYKDNELLIDMVDYPMLNNLLLQLPDLRAVSIINLPAKYRERKEKGPEISNTTLRAVLPIQISGVKKSGIWCDGETRLFNEKQWVIYDNSREHSIFNKHKQLATRILVVDIERPTILPKGIADDINTLNY